MAVKASAQITLNSVVDIEATYRYYILQSSTSDPPSVPTAKPPLDSSSGWSDSEPTYTEGSTNSLYYVDCTVFSDGAYEYSKVSLSTSYEAAKLAYNKAQNAKDTADSAQDTANSAQDSVDSNSGRLQKVESAIEFLNGSVLTTVKDDNGETIAIQNNDGWTFSISGLSENLESIASDLSAASNDISGINSDIDEINKNIISLGEYKSYIKFGTDNNGAPTITLGKDGSNFKVVITNEAIKFMENNSTPAYMNNQTLFINKASVNKELSQGKFVWIARTDSNGNGNYGLMWRG